MSTAPISVADAAATCDDVLESISGAVITNREFLETVLTGTLAGGHVLLEDVPGTGKTLTSRCLAQALGLEFNRIQFTPDLLPSDITGSHVYNEDTHEFQFNEGPIFANVVLADEINRAPPKTQAALLEAMEEKQVSVDGEIRQLPDPFFVIATQNPVEQEGTFELPEAQRDRFIVKTEMGYPDGDGERELLDRRTDRLTASPTVERVVDGRTVADLQQVPEFVTVDGKLKDYMIDLGRATREHDAVAAGVSPRGVQRLLEASRARAVIRGRGYVAPDDVKAVARPVMTHRLVTTARANVDGTTKEDVVEAILEGTTVPAMETV
ncbi:AAA family ATPase [Halomontanus rarus]|uniref:AAA family ATPase n=1 Tax=Halomontanus rarus TaxID=3034020 RepID=UPI001A99FBA5